MKYPTPAHSPAKRVASNLPPSKVKRRFRGIATQVALNQAETDATIAENTVAVLETLVRGHPEAANYRINLASCLNHLGLTRVDAGKPADACNGVTRLCLEAARRLLNLVNLRGATDNATIVVVRAS